MIKNQHMKKMILMLLAASSAAMTFAQGVLTTLPSGGNKKASVSERIGLTDVTIHYDRPGVKGREGKIWGELVPVGFTDPGFGSSHAAPWRAGANENTTIEFSTDVMIGDKTLPAGRYGFFVAYDPNACTLIFSKNSTSWGHFYYNDKEDALRVTVKPQAADKPVEWLKYEFMNETENSATIALQWEKLVIPFSVKVDYINTQLKVFREELRTNKGFAPDGWVQAAQWCVQNKVNLEEALLWADSATSTTFGGERSFQNWSTKAQVLQLLGRGTEAADIMKKALPLGSMIEIHQYGRQLLGMKMYKEAFDAFKLNAEKNPNQFTTYMGLARGYSGLGDFKNALKNAQLALPLAPNQQNKAAVEGMVEKLKAGKDVN